jgi:3-oxoacyl-[acyl-carrier protein] reductase
MAELASGEHVQAAGDMSSSSVADSLRETLLKKWTRVDALVHCAGISQATSTVDSPLEEWHRTFDIMIDGAIRMTRAAVSLMDNGGRVIHVTSIHGERAEANASAYAMSKAAINSFCRALAMELASKGILANAIAPGFVDTPMCITNGVNELETEWFKSNYVVGNHLPLRRAAQPEEIAGVAAFLAGPDSTYITGQVITVDGGLTITF